MARCVAGEGCRSRPSRWSGTGHRRRQALCRRVRKGTSWDWSSSGVAFTVSRGPRGAAASAPSLRPPLYQQAIVPSAFRLQVGWSAQEPPFKFFPVVPGIPDQLSRHTYPFLPVVRRPVGVDEPECGLLFDARGTLGLFGYSATVWTCNLFQLPATLDEFITLPRFTYDTLAELAAGGWTVD